jgi:hypothetical protein
MYTHPSPHSDQKPYVTVTVYSDEIGVVKDLDKAAVLAKSYNSDAMLNGWDLSLYRFRSAQQKCGKDFVCEGTDADGRYYVVEVCALDAAGLWACDWDEVGVPTKDGNKASSHGKSTKHGTAHTPGEYYDDLYVVAQDTGYWNATQNNLPFYQGNEGLPNGQPFPSQEWAQEVVLGDCPTNTDIGLDGCCVSSIGCETDEDCPSNLSCADESCACLATGADDQACINNDCGTDNDPTCIPVTCTAASVDAGPLSATYNGPLKNPWLA